jgi:2-polyprenyl-3-methyl-5-hydroxy-6-metoxy-1,4-benzoquinol methylase
MFDDKSLQNHEFDYWIHRNTPNKHAEFYREFFDFSLCENKEVLDVGCGGNPITDFSGVEINLSILDPLIDSLLESGQYDNLKKYNAYSKSILELEETSKFDTITCLNVIDHFNDDEFLFVDVFHKALKEGGQLWLYYDVRPVNACDHLAIDSKAILEKIETKFNIEKISHVINPKHKGWSGITSSVRLIATKK